MNEKETEEREPIGFCTGECKVGKEVGPEAHWRLEFAVLVGIGAAEAFRRGRQGKGMRGFQRSSSEIALGLFRGVGCLVAYANRLEEERREVQTLEKMLDAPGEQEGRA